MAVFVHDSFTDTDAVTLQAHTGETGATWAKPTGSSGDFAIYGNRAYTAAFNTYYYASGVPASPDYEVWATIRFISTIAATKNFAVAGRMTSGARTCYIAGLEYASPNYRMRLRTWIDNVAGTIDNNAVLTAPTDNSDHEIRLRMIGTKISGYWDGALVLGPFTSSEITAAGKAGIYSVSNSTTTTGMHFDSITAADWQQRGPESSQWAAMQRANLY